MEKKMKEEVSKLINKAVDAAVRIERRKTDLLIESLTLHKADLIDLENNSKMFHKLRSFDLSRREICTLLRNMLLPLHPESSKMLKARQDEVLRTLNMSRPSCPPGP